MSRQSTGSLTLRAVPGFFVQGDKTWPAEKVAGLPHLGLQSDKEWRDINVYLAQQESQGKVAKLLLFLRHGEGIHNVDKARVGDRAWDDHHSLLDKYIDAPLTDEGIKQAEHAGHALQTEIREYGLVMEGVLVSPLDRTLHTYAVAFREMRDIPVTAVEKARETLGVCPCDRRLSMAGKRLAYSWVDFDEIQDENDVLWLPDHRENDAEIEARAHELLDYIMNERNERFLCVVSHSGLTRACLRVLGHRQYRPRNGEIVPVLIEEA